MTNEVTEKPTTLGEVLESYREVFEQSLTDKKMTFIKESQFARQAITSNNYLLRAARENPASLKDAIVNVAAVGLSLERASAYAYLVPRMLNKKLSVCLDISYKGLVKVATDSGSIKWVQAEIVKENDVFKRVGIDKAPIHEIDDFKARGDMVGVYCVAKTADGDYLTEVMSKQEIDDIKKLSEAGKKGFGPWFGFYEEMAKKTVVKRAAKLWPKTERVINLDRAIDTINEHEGIDFNNEESDLLKLESYQTEPGFLYEFQHGIFRGKSIADIYEADEIDRLEEYIAKTESRKNQSGWMPEMIRVVRETLENFEMYRDAYLETQGE